MPRWRSQPSPWHADKTLDYTGTGVLKFLTSPGIPSISGLPPSAGGSMGKVVPGASGATGVRIPFSIHGTFDEPKFALAGRPEFMRGAGSQPQQKPPQPQLPRLTEGVARLENSQV